MRQITKAPPGAAPRQERARSPTREGGVLVRSVRTAWIEEDKGKRARANRERARALVLPKQMLQNVTCAVRNNP